MPLNKQGDFTFNHSNQQDDLYKGMTAAEIKAAFDSQAIELKATLNSLIDSLKSTGVDDSGAENIGIQPIFGVTGANVQSALEDLRLRVNEAVAGTIPDGSIGPEKLSFEVAADAEGVSVTDAGNHFTSTNVEGVLDELFTSANSVKTNVSSAIGLPATANDTGAQLASKITTEKGKLATEIGDGSSANTLQYLTDRLIVRSNAIATAVNAKGTPATSADTLAQLATKIGQISTGKKWAEGDVQAPSFPFTITVNGLDFTPSIIVLYTKASNNYWRKVYVKPIGIVAADNLNWANYGITSAKSNSDWTVTNGGFSTSIDATTTGLTVQSPTHWIAYE